MIGLKLPSRKRARDEAEKPFWISFADLMTALMVLFLVSVTVALFAVTTKQPPPPVTPDPIAEHEKKIRACMVKFKEEIETHSDAKVDVENRSVSFGEKARFDLNKYSLSPESGSLLRKFAPEVLTLADSECGEALFRRVVVEGYTSREGSYLLNLDLSLKRAHSVVCALLEDAKGEPGLDDTQKGRIRNLFMVGGYSSNTPKDTLEESRRVEFKLEFWGLNEKKKNGIETSPEQELGKCQLNWRTLQ